jgi:tRNA-binding protein
MADLSWSEFERVELRVGTIIDAKPFPEARNRSYILQLDFGPEIGTLQSSAQITDLYSPADLLGRQVMAVTNFPPKQIGPIMSACLVTGFHRDDNSVVLAVPDAEVPNGTRLA